MSAEVRAASSLLTLVPGVVVVAWALLLAVANLELVASSGAEDCDHRRTLSVTGARTDESLVA
jgi:hypothetical protein